MLKGYNNIFPVFSKSSTVERPWNGYGLAGEAARRVRSRALPCSFGEYTQICAAWTAGGTPADRTIFVQVAQVVRWWSQLWSHLFRCDHERKRKPTMSLKDFPCGRWSHLFLM